MLLKLHALGIVTINDVMKSKYGKPETPRRSKRILLKQFWIHAHGSRYMLLVISVGMLCDGILQAGLVNYLKILVDRLLDDPSSFVRESLPIMAIIGLAAGALFFPISYGAHMACNVLGSRLVSSFRMALYRHLQCLSISFFNSRRDGEITSRLTQDVDIGVRVLIGLLTGAAWAMGILVTAVFSMLLLSWKLSLIFVGMNILYFSIWRIFRQQINTHARTVRDHAGMVTASVTEDVSSMVVMKSFAREERFYNRFDETQNRLYKAEVMAARVNFAFSDILQVVGKFVAPVIILGAGAFMVDRDGLSIGALVAFWSYWGLVQGPLAVLYGAGPSLASCLASMDRIMDFYEETPLPADRFDAVPFYPQQGDVSFEHVAFTYPGEDPAPIFSDLSFTIPASSSLGVVGSSGAGKSTLVQLALRFYDPDSGCIRIDGMDLCNMTQASLRQATGVVLQESLLISGTIRDNLLLGDEAASDEQIWKALEKAGASDFVAQLQYGLDEQIGERGVTLSGGQRQRLCIARVFLKDPPLVIFDEATSALDTTTEALIQKSMERLLKGRTSIIIAHRLSTIVSCDRIMMLKDGKVLGVAPHAELVNTCPEYAALVAGQDISSSGIPA